MSPGLGRQVRALGWVLCALIPGAAALLLVGRIPGVEFSLLLRDPAASTHQPFYLGAFSQLGILFWCATVTLCLYTAFLLRRGGGDPHTSRFLLAAGLYALLLLIDDLWMFHEGICRQYLHIPEVAVYAVYLGLLIVLFGWFVRPVRRSEWAILAVALGLFSLSILIDRYDHSYTDAYYLREDGSKFLGILVYFTYFLRTCRAATATNGAPAPACTAPSPPPAGVPDRPDPSPPSA